MTTADRVPVRNNVARVQRLARERADAQARRIPWQRLLHTRNEYIDWQEFYLWVRSVLEMETSNGWANIEQRTRGQVLCSSPVNDCYGNFCAPG